MKSVKMKDACIRLEGDNLILENSEIYREIALAGNVLATVSFRNLRTGKEWGRVDAAYEPRRQMDDAIAAGKPTETCMVPQAALSFAGDEEFIRRFTRRPEVTLQKVEDCPFEQPGLVVRVALADDELRLTRCYQIYPQCPAVVCWTELSGRCARKPVPPPSPDPRLNTASRADVHDSIFLNDRHLRIRNVRFFDCTDYQDNYVQEEERTSYLTFDPWVLKGNLLFAESLVDGQGFFLIKEAPVLRDQPDRPDGDFVYAFDRGRIGVSGWGISPEDLEQLDSIPSWRTVIGVYDGSDFSEAAAVKNYLRQRCRPVPGRNWVITANQYGDWPDGHNLSEDFVRAEIDACAELGIPAYMLDGAWQSGGLEAIGKARLSEVSPFHDLGDYWAPDPKKFPHGLKPLADYARSRNVELMFWFNPDACGENRNADKDAAVLLRMHRELGVRVFKIDGVWMCTRRAELNTRRMLETVVRASGGQVSYQLDITNGARWGFLHGHPLGVLFVENRFNTFRNYFPFRVHKNLWQLARYLMPQRLQFEFLNNSAACSKRYPPMFPPDDPFTPERYPIAYCFAVVMFSNPLAWLQPSKLSAEQRAALAPLIRTYNGIRDELFSGDIYPIGEKPSGRSITGFQSHDEKALTGFVCAYREVTDRPGAVMRLHRISDFPKIAFTLLMGKGTVGRENDGYYFSLPESRSFALWRYEIGTQDIETT